MRLEDESAVIREYYPDELIDVAVFVTELGGTDVLMFGLAILFWLSSRRESALVISYAFAGFSLLLAIRAVLGMPRPPAELFAISIDGDGYGFPSGHAFAAAVVYGGLVSAFDRTRDRAAVFAAGTLIVLISLSRVVLGVHYLGDVLVGAAFGLVFLAAMNRLTRGDPTRGFAVAVCIAIPSLLVVGLTADALLGLGGSIGGLLASRRIDRLPDPRSRLEGGVLAVAGSGFVVALLVLESAISFAPALAALYAAVVAGIFLAPVPIRRLGGSVLAHGNP